jgi:hypothetical protein
MFASRAALLAGALGLAAIPAGVLASWQLGAVGLLRAVEVAVPVGLALGLVAVSLARRSRYRVARSVKREGERVVRVAGLLAWSSVYVGMIGAIALGFYGLLVVRG